MDANLWADGKPVRVAVIDHRPYDESLSGVSLSILAGDDEITAYVDRDKAVGIAADIFHDTLSVVGKLDYRGSIKAILRACDAIYKDSPIGYSEHMEQAMIHLEREAEQHQEPTPDEDL